MIITKTPFRISFAGGGSDMADFYREHGGCVLSTSINRYMYLSLHPYFDSRKTALKYSQTEIVNDLNEINHTIFRCVLNDKEIEGVEISSTADVPSGTGLGSSSSFTVGLLHTVYCFKGKYISKARLAEEACKVEIEKIGNPIGKQDQYAAAFGGLNFITFHQDDTVSVEPVIAKPKTIRNLQENLVMFYTGITHDANAILAEQKKNLGKYLALSSTEDIYITRNGTVVAKLSNPFQDRVDMAKSLFGILPADITLEQAREERLDRI